MQAILHNKDLSRLCFTWGPSLFSLVMTSPHIALSDGLLRVVVQHDDKTSQLSNRQWQWRRLDDSFANRQTHFNFAGCLCRLSRQGTEASTMGMAMASDFAMGNVNVCHIVQALNKPSDKVICGETIANDNGEVSHVEHNRERLLL
ncbi:hypothetical protein L1987_03187 [Smallanthus sonchifolius]|uniref:Uncharacterized protein n=1 Tax=Smallanthus sonchifolius TaxID=185202 RepID=A0ACB9KA24_9ASTR|nr:hypothetical protein L1987_03187 [Smallanthus sonchifolius]